MARLIKVIKINGYFLNHCKCLGREWDSQLQMHSHNGEFVISNGFGGLGVLDATSKMLLNLYMPFHKGIQTSRSGAFDVEIKIFL
jgi:hypothetical protein